MALIYESCVLLFKRDVISRAFRREYINRLINFFGN